MYRNTYVEVDLDTIEANVKNICEYFNNYKYYIGVVKGNAYGHDTYIVNTLVESGINYLAVSTIEEAINIRTWKKDIPILCLVPIPLEYINVCIEQKIAITIHDYSYLDELIKEKINGKLSIHLKIDCGMNRLGFKDKYDVKNAVDNINDNKNLILEGIYTHFGTSGLIDTVYDNQVEKFLNITKLIDLKSIPIVHLGHSSNLVSREKLEFANGIRLGIIMYGFSTLPVIQNDIKTRAKNIIKKILKRQVYEPVVCPIILNKAFNLYSEVISVKKAFKGEYVGYGTKTKLKSDAFLATLPLGYADGLSPNMNKVNIMINGEFYKIIGTVNMNMITVLVDEHVMVGDKALIIGDELDISKSARKVGLTSYELMTMINKNVPRVFIKNDRVKKIVDYN